MALARNVTPNSVFLLGLLAVAGSTAVLPSIGGYGTVLFQLVVLGAWGLLAAITSGSYADLNHGPLWALALVLNVLFFLLPAGPWWLVTRRKWPALCGIVLAVWCVLYLACLFVLFPATDGP